jgi:hypothetical protein
MLPHAMIVVSNSNGRGVGIRAINVPILPIGSNLDIYLRNEAIIENGRIEEYGFSSRHGVIIRVEMRDDMSDEMLDKMWNAIAEVSVKDPENYFNYIYPDPVDFSVKFPLPPL